MVIFSSLKNWLNDLLVLTTLLIGLMLTSCLGSVAERGGGGGSTTLRGIIYELPALSTDTESITVATNINPQVTMVNASVAYYRGYFGQGVTIAFIDRGINLRGNEKGHIAFGPDASTRIVNPVRISGTAHVTSVTNNMTVAKLDVATRSKYHLAAMGLAAGGITLNRHFGIAISSHVMPIDIADTSSGVDIDGDIGTAFKYAVDNHAKIINYGFIEFFRGFSPDSGGYRVTASYNNNSYNFNLASHVPLVLSLTSVASVWASLSTPVSLASVVASVVADKDVVVVVGSDSGVFNGLRSSVFWYDLSSNSTATINFTTFINEAEIETISWRNQFTMTVNQKVVDFLGNGNFENVANMPEGYFAALPFIDQRLQSKYILAVGVESNKVISSNNGCGASKYWCVAALRPDNNVRVPSGDNNQTANTSNSNQDQGGVNRADFASAIVAGALAVIQSRMPNFKVEAARAVMFRTAEKNGFTGVSPIYGHGVVDLAAAISLVGEITLISPVGTSAPGTTTSSQFLVNSSIALSPAFRSLQQQVSDISMAVDVLGNGFYFDTAFSSVLDTDALQKQDMTLGFAAQDLLSTSKQDIGGIGVQTNRQGNLANFGFKRKQGLLSYSLCAKCKNSVWDEYAMEYEPLPFFADTKRKLQGGWSFGDSVDTFVALGLDEDNQKDKYAQYGINWKGVQLGEWDLAGSFSRIQEQQGYLLGSKFSGAFSLGESSSTQLGLRAQRYIEGWRLFGGVEYGKTQVNTIDTSLVRSVDGLSYAGWRLGLDKIEVFRSKDKVHIGITRLPSVISGNMDILVSHATGKTAFDQDLQMDYLSEAELRKHKINLEDSNAFVYRLGYSTNIHKRQRLALGFEHYTDKTNSDNTAFSAQYKVEF